jgi:hypothetical protein
VKRVTVFAKGNVDIYDSLHSCRIDGKLCWNGINEVVRDRYAGITVRLQHETWTRSDALLEADGELPEELQHRALNLGSYPLISQFSNSVFQSNADVVILSVQPDVTGFLWRHARSGHLLLANDNRLWSKRDRDWLFEEFTGLDFLDPSESMSNFEKIISRIRENSTAEILIFNMSPIVPGEHVHCYRGLEFSISTRIRRFNLALVELSERNGISIVDVDGIVARAGADRVKLDFIHYTPEGYRLIAEEVVRILDDLGIFSWEAAKDARQCRPEVQG